MTTDASFYRLDAMLSALPDFETNYYEFSRFLAQATEAPSAEKLDFLATHLTILQTLRDRVLDGKGLKIGFSPDALHRIHLVETQFIEFSQKTNHLFLTFTGNSLVDYQNQMILAPQFTSEQKEEPLSSPLQKSLKSRVCYCLVL